jgi:hypothetical protein
VNEFGLLLQILLVLTATVVPIVVVIRLINGQDTDLVAGMFDVPSRLPWPLGVQEEEPLPWKFGPAF